MGLRRYSLLLGKDPYHCDAGKAIIEYLDPASRGSPSPAAGDAGICPAGIATQDPELRKRLNVEYAAERLDRFFRATTELMQVMARACGHTHLNEFSKDDLATWHKDLADLAGIERSGFDPTRGPES